MALTPSTTLPGIEAVAQRIENARQGFTTLCVENHSFTPAQAAHILAVYKRLRCVKLDSSIGRYQFTDGVYYERGVMENALTQPA